jgi:hypothetical protein
MNSVLESFGKDQLVLAMLSVMGGEHQDVNERDLFLACWHAFPNAMRWADTSLPNPDTFTASLRRLDADRLIKRVGKAERSKRKKPSRKRGPLDAGRSGVVKARILEGGLERAGITADAVADVAQLAPPPAGYSGLDPALLITIALQLREKRPTDEAALVETVFHKFPAVFAYQARPEFPDIGSVRDAISDAIRSGWIDKELRLTDTGREAVPEGDGLQVRIDASESQRTGAFKFAERIELSAGYKAFSANRTLQLTKSDELFRLLRVPPTTDPRPLATALEARARELRRIDKGELVEYLLQVAESHNPDVLPLVTTEHTRLATTSREASGEEERS